MYVIYSIKIDHLFRIEGPSQKESHRSIRAIHADHTGTIGTYVETLTYHTRPCNNRSIAEWANDMAFPSC